MDFKELELLVKERDSLQDMLVRLKKNDQELAIGASRKGYAVNSVSMSLYFGADVHLSSPAIVRHVSKVTIEAIEERLKAINKVLKPIEEFVSKWELKQQ